MKKLAISIPTYNRIGQLHDLLDSIMEQISVNSLIDCVQVCVSDDHSTEDPSLVINEIITQYPQIEIKYNRNKCNEGMDRNFMNAVMMADAEYCWLIGNDDVLEADGLVNVISFLDGHDDCDFFVTPFNIFGVDNEYRDTIYPLSENGDRRFDTSNNDELINLIQSVKHNSGVFGFLSNVVFRHQIWVDKKNKFDDKMDSIFIQMYLNIDELLRGAVYYYSMLKIIKNFADDETNSTMERRCRILFGLDGVTEYFFQGNIKNHFKKILTDTYIDGDVWNLPIDNQYRKLIVNVESPKNNIYKRYFISKDCIEKKLSGHNIIVFGAGEYGRKAIRQLEDGNIKIVEVVDSNSERSGEVFCGYRIKNIKDLQSIVEKYHDYYVVVANYKYLCDMVKTVENQGISRISIIT